jgi:hypothetical protein
VPIGFNDLHTVAGSGGHDGRESVSLKGGFGAEDEGNGALIVEPVLGKAVVLESALGVEAAFDVNEGCA